MQLTQRTTGDVTILDVRGRLARDDGYGEIKERVNRLIQQGNASILLNLCDVSYMDSTCVGELVAAFVTVRNAGGRLRVLVSPTGHIPELLRTVKLDQVLGMFDSEPDALSNFGARPDPRTDRAGT